MRDLRQMLEPERERIARRMTELYPGKRFGLPIEAPDPFIDRISLLPILGEVRGDGEVSRGMRRRPSMATLREMEATLLTVSQDKSGLQ